MNVILATRIAQWDKTIKNEIKEVNFTGAAYDEEQLLSIISRTNPDAVILSEFIHVNFQKTLSLIGKIQSINKYVKIVFYANYMDDARRDYLNKLSITHILLSPFTIEATKNMLFRE
jgi:response regulator of citrate/malate metabolism